MTLDALETLTADAKIRYLHMFLRGEVLQEFETICVHFGNTTIMHLNKILLVLCAYFPSIDNLPNKNSVMRHGIKMIHKLKVRHYTAHMI